MPDPVSTGEQIAEGSYQAADAMKGLGEQSKKTIKDMSGFEGLKKTFSDLTGSISKMINPLKMISNEFGTLTKRVDRVTDLGIAFGDKMKTANFAVRDSAMEMGIAFEDLAKGQMTLLGTTSMSAAQVSAYTKEMGFLHRATNVSVESFAKLAGNAEGFNKSFNSKTLREVATIFSDVQNNVGLTQEEMTKLVDSSTKSVDRLSAFGDNVTALKNVSKATANISAMYKKVGLDIGKATQLMDRFLNPDALEENAYLISQMGMSFGEYTDMLEGGDAAALASKMSEGLYDAAQNAKDMSFFQKQAYAKTLGVSAQELTRLGNLSRDEFEATQESGAETGDTIEQKQVKAMEKLNVKMTQFKETLLDIGTAMMNALRPLIDFFLKFKVEIAGFFDKIWRWLETDGVKSIKTLLGFFEKLNVKLLAIGAAVVAIGVFIAKLKIGKGGGLADVGKGIGGFLSGLAQGFKEWDGKAYKGMLWFALGVGTIIAALMLTGFVSSKTDVIGEAMTGLFNIFSGITLEGAAKFVIGTLALGMVAYAFGKLGKAKVKTSDMLKGAAVFALTLVVLLGVGALVALIPPTFMKRMEVASKSLAVISVQMLLVSLAVMGFIAALAILGAATSIIQFALIGLAIMAVTVLGIIGIAALLALVPENLMNKMETSSEIITGATVQLVKLAVLSGLILVSLAALGVTGAVLLAPALIGIGVMIGSIALIKKLLEYISENIDENLISKSESSLSSFSRISKGLTELLKVGEMISKTSAKFSTGIIGSVFGKLKGKLGLGTSKSPIAMMVDSIKQVALETESLGQLNLGQAKQNINALGSILTDMSKWSKGGTIKVANGKIEMIIKPGNEFKNIFDTGKDSIKEQLKEIKTVLTEIRGVKSGGIGKLVNDTNSIKQIQGYMATESTGKKLEELTGI